MEVFKEELYIVFIKEKIEWSPLQRKDNLTLNEWVEAIAQQKYSLPNFLDRSRSYISYQLGKIFKIFLSNKPIGVPITKWFLYNYGFKNCYLCSEIKNIDQFPHRKNTWDNLHNYCSICTITETKKYNLRNKTKILEYREENKLHKKEIDKIYYNEHKDKITEYKKQWKIDNKDKVNASNAKRRATKLNAAPKWLNKQQLIEIEDIYYCCSEYNRLLTEKFHVDHIVPLQGKNISGLHVPCNLQILTATENLQKGTKLSFQNS